MDLYELRKHLEDSANLPINYRLNGVKKYYLNEEVKNPLVNRLVKKAREHKDFKTLDLLKWFIEYQKYIIKGTPYDVDEKTQNTFLRMMWEASGLGPEVIKQLRDGTLLPEINKGPETPEEKKARLRLQAKRMREAKLAKKKAEEAQAKSVVVQPTPQPQAKKLSEEEIERIQWLRKLWKKKINYYSISQY